MKRADRRVHARALPFLLLLAGAGPAWSQGATRAYVSHGGADVVTAIDTAAGTVAGAVPVGARPGKMTITRDGTRAYVANAGANSISAIATATDTVADTIPIGDSPSALAVAPDGGRLYVMTGAGAVEVVDTASHALVATIPVGATGDIAITPDGRRLYVAAGLVSVIDTASNAVVRSFAAETVAVDGVSHSASSIAVAPDGTRAYVGVVTFNMAAAGFSAGGRIVVVDTASEAIANEIDLFSLPGSLALTPDGSRLYVGIQSTWVNTGYGAGFFPGRHIVVIDAITGRIAATIDLGADGPNWTQQNTAGGLGVTADRSAVYAVVPRLSRVAVADVNTSAVTRSISVMAGPRDLAIVPDPGAALVPYAIDAVDDSATVSTAGGTAVANVLANDRLGGLRVETAHVTLTPLSWSEGLALDPARGAVTVAAGTAVGVHALAYRICEIAAASNCDDATVTVTVHLPYAIDAVNDAAVTRPGRTALASVLANDTLNGTPAAGRVTLSALASTSAGITLDVAGGSVFVAIGTVPGAHTLSYRICETASPANCDAADVSITVNPFPIDAVNDVGAAPRTGGVALANVLANDTFAGAAATLAKVSLSPVSSAHGGIALNVASGAVNVAAGTPVGTYALQYRICEIATPSNCDDAVVAVAVEPLRILAVNDSATGSSKVANTVLASVLANDWLGSARATPSNVALALVSLTPANSKIQLDLADGSVDVLGKTSSGLYSMVYEICEIAMPANCGRATVRIDLSGK